MPRLTAWNFSTECAPPGIVDDGVYYKKVEMNEEGNITSTSEEQFFPCSSVIIAISQGAQSRIVSTTTGLEISSHGLLATNEHGETTREGIFASGDVVLGARTVVEAVKYSKQVADEMDAYLRRRREAKQEDNAGKRFICRTERRSLRSVRHMVSGRRTQ